MVLSTMYRDHESMIKFLAIVAFGLIIASLIIIATTPPAGGYEISVYAAYPGYFWLFLIVSAAIGVYILVTQAFKENSSRLWLAGLAVIVLVNTIVLSSVTISSTINPMGWLTWG